MKILVVDDTSGEVIAELLKREHAVSLATTGAEAIQANQIQGPFDLVIADLRLADMNFCELSNALGNPYMLLVTASPVIRKPIDRTELLETVSSYIPVKH